MYKLLKILYEISFTKIVIDLYTHTSDKIKTIKNQNMKSSLEMIQRDVVTWWPDDSDKGSKLLSMTEVIMNNESRKPRFKKHTNFYVRYACFLSQNLMEPYYVNDVLAHPLNRFYPCDLDGNRLYDPSKSKDMSVRTLENLELYQQAKSRILFEDMENLTETDLGFEKLVQTYSTIEDLIKMEPILTYKGLKISGL